MERLLFALAALALSVPAFAVGSLADVQVYDRSLRRTLPVHWGEGAAFVAGAPGNEYSVRIRNRSDVDLLAVVSVDGVNVVTGETASPEQTGHVISTRGSLEIKGWRKSLERTAAFYFTDLSDSYAARTGRPDDVGVIGMALFKRMEPRVLLEESPWPNQQPQSRAEDAASGASPAPRPAEKAAVPAQRLGTGHGRSESAHARYVGFERESAMPNELIGVRYDSRQNLIALGIIRAPRRTPDPFPAAFVPDPPARW